MTSARATTVAAGLGSAGLLMSAARGDGSVALTAALIGNIAVPALWAAAMLVNRRVADVLPTLAALAVAVAVVAGPGEAASGALVALAGVAGGAAMQRRWRILPTLGVAAAFLAPVLVLELSGEGIVETTEALYAENRRALAEGPAAELSESERQTVLADYDAVVEQMLAVQRRFWPGMVW